MSSERVMSIIENNRGKFTGADIEALKKQEELLQFESFGSTDALALGMCILRLKIEYPEQIAIFVTRESDQMMIFQYLMDGKKQRNLDFAAGKRNALLTTGHSSLLTLAEACTGTVPEALLAEDKDIIPVGGAFPIYVNGVHTATIAVSGLHEGKDHEIIVRALAEYLDVELPEYKGHLV